MTESAELDYMVMADLNFLYMKYWRLWKWVKFAYYTVKDERKLQNNDIICFAKPTICVA